jgi:mannose-1-phosphate guanylyltransferase / mannose-6-phosphate isomerase
MQTPPLIITPVILCGGSGTRLWPLSRAGFPKQFLTLTGTDSLFQQAIRRVNNLSTDDIKVHDTLVVTNEEHRFLALDQLRELGDISATLLLEPTGKNTAPALTIASLNAIEDGQDPILVVTPADQTITDQTAFAHAMHKAIREAANGTIVILGIHPDRPETGYGYIKAHNTTLSVDRFVEKPDASTAQQYLDEGGYFWNAGMFVLRASVWLAAIQRFRPDILKASTEAMVDKSTDIMTTQDHGQTALRFVRPSKAAFTSIPSESIDYAVMEPATHPTHSGTHFPIKMMPLNAGWNDLGAWDAVWNAHPKDQNGNVHIGDVLSTDSHNTFVHASTRLVSLVGIDNVIVIETADAVLVADKARSQEVKHIVTALQHQQREEHLLHRKVHRPWGWYDSIDEEARFKVKRIQVKPGASLSLQKHHHRAEHWIVVTGTAEITCGDKTILLSENQSTYIPLGETHRLANPGTIPLEIIEVQSGSYLGEDDIVRFEDHYGR